MNEDISVAAVPAISKEHDASRMTISRLYDGVPLHKGDRCIRLLTLEQKGSDLVGSLTPHNLDNSDKHWLALSYTWDAHPEDPDRDKSFSITIDGVMFSVQINLWRALSHVLEKIGNFRNGLAGYEPPVEIPSPAYLWVDTICIDQKDDCEKSHQVALMSDIYRRAECVIAWMTPDPRTPAPQTHALESPRRAFWETIQSNIYWSRMWIIQEVVVAERVILLHGRLWYVDPVLQDLWHLSDTLQLRAIYHKRIPSQTQRLEIRGETWLTHLIFSSAFHQCSNPKDRVYALLGMVPSRYILKPDYSKSIVEILVNLLHAEWVTHGYFKSFGGGMVVALAEILGLELIDPRIFALEYIWERDFGEARHDLSTVEKLSQWLVGTARGRGVLQDYARSAKSSQTGNLMLVNKTFESLEALRIATGTDITDFRRILQGSPQGGQDNTTNVLELPSPWPERASLGL